MTIIAEIQFRDPGLNHFFRKKHGFIGPILLLDPEDDRNARLIFLPIRHIGKHIVEACKKFSVLLPVPCVPSGIKSIDQDIMPAHVRQSFVGDNLHDQANGLTVEIAKPVHLIQGDHSILQLPKE